MSPKSLFLLLVVGLCAAQVAPAAVAPSRHDRGVKEILDAARQKLGAVLGAAQDAARSSVETVGRFIQKLEADALNAGTARLTAAGIPLNLTSVAELLKSNVKTCVTEDNIKSQAQDIVTDLVSCVSKDAATLKTLIKQMQDMWVTAQTMPATMAEIGKQCGKHGDNDVKGDALLEGPDGAANIIEVPTEITAHDVAALVDKSDHDLAEKSNELLQEAVKTRNKRFLWGFGRITRCVKSVYSLVKSDMVMIPGQIIAAAANAYRVVQTANHDFPGCINTQARGAFPKIRTLAMDIGTCVSKVDFDEVAAKNPELAGLRTLANLASKLASIKDDPLAAFNSVRDDPAVVLGALSVLPGGAQLANKLSPVLNALGALPRGEEILSTVGEFRKNPMAALNALKDNPEAALNVLSSFPGGVELASKIRPALEALKNLPVGTDLMTTLQGLKDDPTAVLAALSSVPGGKDLADKLTPAFTALTTLSKSAAALRNIRDDPLAVLTMLRENPTAAFDILNSLPGGAELAKRLSPALSAINSLAKSEDLVKIVGSLKENPLAALNSLKDNPETALKVLTSLPGGAELAAKVTPALEILRSLPIGADLSTTLNKLKEDPAAALNALSSLPGGKDLADKLQPALSALSTLSKTAATLRSLKDNPEATLNMLRENPSAALDAISSLPGGAELAKKLSPAIGALSSLANNGDLLSTLDNFRKNPMAALTSLKDNPEGALNILNSLPGGAELATKLSPALQALHSLPAGADLTAALSKLKDDPAAALSALSSFPGGKDLADKLSPALGALNTLSSLKDNPLEALSDLRSLLGGEVGDALDTGLMGTLGLLNNDENAAASMLASFVGDANIAEKLGDVASVAESKDKLGSAVAALAG